MVPKAVSRMTSTSGAMALAACSSSMPERAGSLRSVRSRSRPPACRRSRGARPSEATTTRYPSRVSVRSRLSRSPGSSSETSRVAGSGMDGPLDRQPDGEAGARARPVRPADLAAVLLDDLARDRQAEAGPLRLGREERLEQSLGDLLGNTAAGVGHRDLHDVTLPPAGQRQLPAPGERPQPLLYEGPEGLA